MPTSLSLRFIGTLGLAAALVLSPRFARAEDSDDAKTDTTQTTQSDQSEQAEEAPPAKPAKPAKRAKKKKPRRYMEPDTDRVDAGVFHVGFAGGANFYTEPVFTQQNGTSTATGDYTKDFGFQAGIFFDYDYSEITENVPLMLRGMIGYKYILSSTNVFTFDGMVRRQFRLSEAATFGVGIGASAAVWYRTANTGSNGQLLSNEEIIFLPSMLLGFGFEYNPFMIDFKWLINRFGQNSTITGLELYFGFRM